MPNAITCRELIEFLDDYVADRLTPPMRQIFEQHLGMCRHCRDYLTTYKATIDLARGAHHDAHAADAKVGNQNPEDIVRAVLAARRSN
jgi:anti-sigma factor RsiW